MRLAGSSITDQQHILGIFKKLTTMQRHHQRLAHNALRRIEAGQITVGRKLGNLYLVVDGTHIAC